MPSLDPWSKANGGSLEEQKAATWTGSHRFTITCSHCLTCSVCPGWAASARAWVSSTWSSPLRSWLCALWRHIPPLASVRARNGPGCCRRHSGLSRKNQPRTYINDIYKWCSAVDCTWALPKSPFREWATFLCTSASMKSSSRSSVRNSVVKAHKWAPAEWPIRNILSCKGQAEHFHVGIFVINTQMWLHWIWKWFKVSVLCQSWTWVHSLVPRPSNLRYLGPSLKRCPGDQKKPAKTDLSPPAFW